MFKFILSCLFLFSFSNANANAANLHLQLKDSEKYSVQARSIIASYFRSVESYLPPQIAFIKSLNVNVQFKNLQGRPEEMLNPKGKGVLMGYVDPLSFSDTIVLNEQVLELFQNPKYTSQKSFRHNNGRTLAIATLLHEIAHILDKNATFAEPLREDIQKCKDNRKFPDYQSVYFKTCAFAKGARGKISDHPDFSRIIRWDNVKNSQNHPGSPNSYEFENISEFFAVNFEYFLLDSSYACRRPTIHQLYGQIFKWSPTIDQNCKINSQVFFFNSASEVNISPDRVISISYLHAGKGSAVMSRWGHSMFRVTLCKSDLQGPTDSCLQNKTDIVIAFQALTGSMINSMDGLLGNYPSRLFVLDFKKIVDDYSRKEFREVKSYELNFSSAQKKQFALKVLETYWGYSGRYYFLTNNCATEALSLVQAVLPGNHSLQKEFVMTPVGILAVLQKYAVVSQAESQYFPPFTNALNQALDILNYKSQDGRKLTIDQYLAMKATDRRRLFIQKNMKQIKEKAAYQIFERFSLLAKLEELDKKVAELAQATDGSTQAETQDDNTLIKKNSGYIYGIPAANEAISVDEYKALWEVGRLQIMQRSKAFSRQFPELTEEIEEIHQNLNL